MDPRWFKFGFFSWPLIIFSRLVMKICYFLTTPYPWQQSSLIPRYLWASLQWYESTQYKIRSYFMSLKCQEVLCTERTKNQLFKIWLLCTSSISMSMFQCSTSHVTQWQILMSLINSKSVHLNQQREHHLKSTTAIVSTDQLQTLYCELSLRMYR